MTDGSNTGVAIVGTGFAASAHADALARLPHVDLVAVAGSSREKAATFAASWGVERACGSWQELLADERVQAVHNCTPNRLHAEINSACLAAGKHLLSEKPLAMDSGETGALAREAAESGVVTGVCFNYRHFPLVRELKARLANGGGPPHLVRGDYLQDWLLREGDWNWRVEAAEGGRARALGDIGSHWLDLARYVLDDDVVAVCARLGKLHAARRSTPVDTEDFGSVLLRLAGGCQGSFTVSQVTPGRKNRLTIQIDTLESSFAWDQEAPDRLWIGHREGANEELLRDPSLLHPEAAALVHYPGGHQEGWPDALTNLVRDFYAAVRDRGHRGSFATFTDADRTTRVIEAILTSDYESRWVDVEPKAPS